MRGGRKTKGVQGEGYYSVGYRTSEYDNIFIVGLRFHWVESEVDRLILSAVDTMHVERPLTPCQIFVSRCFCGIVYADGRFFGKREVSRTFLACACLFQCRDHLGEVMSRR